MRRLILIVPLLAGCAHGSDQAQAVLAVSADEAAHTYAEAKKRRLVQCQGEQTEEAAIKCMGPFHGDRGTQLLEVIVQAQTAMSEGIKALEELKELTDQ